MVPHHWVRSVVVRAVDVELAAGRLIAGTDSCSLVLVLAVQMERVSRSAGRRAEVGDVVGFVEQRKPVGVGTRQRRLDLAGDCRQVGSACREAVAAAVVFAAGTWDVMVVGGWGTVVDIEDVPWRIRGGLRSLDGL